MKIFTEFKILNKYWWHGVAPLTVDELRASIEKNQRELTNYRLSQQTDDSVLDYLEGCQIAYKLLYLHECLLGEKNIPESKTREHVEELLEMSLPSSLSLSKEEKDARKAQNMHKIIKELFPDIFEAQFDVSKLTVEYVKDVHKVVMDGLLESHGFRTTGAAPAPGNDSPAIPYQYMDPSLFVPELPDLLKDTADRLLITMDLVERVKIVASFFVNFLHIHPFKNGNGRVARLLLSLLLCGHLVVPVYLCGSKTFRDRYLKCLEEARSVQSGNRYVADAMARFILENIDRSYDMICAMLALRENPVPHDSSCCCEDSIQDWLADCSPHLDGPCGKENMQIKVYSEIE